VLARLLLLFTIVPIVELMLLIPLGQWIGLWPTLGLIVVTGVIGAVLGRQQGVAAWRRITEDLGQGRIPSDSLLDGLAVLIAGAFLVTPGVLTDLAGMALLIPPMRRPLKGYLKKRFKRMLTSDNVTFMHIEGPLGGGAPFSTPDEGKDDDVIDVTPAEAEENQPDPQRMN
jgi:UPF0716 protein FxsA